ncbi:hypothetical protein D3C80_1255070 [compost metagenome]
MVDAGPEKVAALTLNRAGDPRLAVGRLGPDEAAVPGGALGLMRATGIGDADRSRLARRQGLGQGDGQATVGVGPARDRLAVHGDGGDGEQRIQFDHDGGSRGRGGEVEDGEALDRLGLGQQLEAKVRLVETQRQLLGRARRAAGQGEGRRIAGGGRLLGKGRGAEQGGGQAEDGGQAQGGGSGRCRHDRSGGALRCNLLSAPFFLSVIPGREANPEPRRRIFHCPCRWGRRLGPGSSLRAVRGDGGGGGASRRAKKKAGVSTGLFKSGQTTLLRRRSVQPAWP